MVEDWIMIRKDTHKFQIVQVHVNGTVTLRKRRNVLERINIRRIKPFYGLSPID